MVSQAKYGRIARKIPTGLSRLFMTIGLTWVYGPVTQITIRSETD